MAALNERSTQKINIMGPIFCRLSTQFKALILPVGTGEIAFFIKLNSRFNKQLLLFTLFLSDWAIVIAKDFLHY